tara:strand:- start:80575 stop:81573 length:999 start_codon:yes stop_codon:yes gene_type:complete
MYLNKSLKSFNSFRVDSSASKYIRIDDIEQLKKILSINKKVKKIILGGGSNILFTKKFNGLCVHMQNKGIEIISETENHVIVEINSGENWNDFVLWCLEKDFGGVENLVLIPGCVGAAPIQNIGAYGVELKDVFESCTTINLETLKKKKYKIKDCKFGYRDSIFKGSLKNKIVITSVQLKLSKNSHKFNLSYESLKNLKSIKKLSIKKIANTIIKIRNSKLPDPKKMGNAGSFFKNPIIDKILFNKLFETFKNIPFVKLTDGKFKIPAAWLIENTFKKGYKKGNVGIYKNQPLVIVNYGDAQGKEVMNFSKDIQKKVSKKFGIELVNEVVIH